MIRCFSRCGRMGSRRLQKPTSAFRKKRRDHGRLMVCTRAREAPATLEMMTEKKDRDHGRLMV